MLNVVILIGVIVSVAVFIGFALLSVLKSLFEGAFSPPLPRVNVSRADEASPQPEVVGDAD
jgi:hypothetical protein